MAEPAVGMRPDESTEFVYRSWPADARQLASIRAEVRRWLAPLDLPAGVDDDVVLAVNEAASNSVEHAYTSATAGGTVELTFWTEPRSICIEIVDHGSWRIPSDQPTGRGRGIHIMRRLMAGILIHHDSRGTRVFLSYPRSETAAERIVAVPADDAGVLTSEYVRSDRPAPGR